MNSISNATDTRTHTITVDTDALGREVSTHPHTSLGEPPLFIQPASARMRDDFAYFSAWFREHRALFDQLLAVHGACFLRGFPLVSSELFNQLVAHYPGMDHGYAAGATPRQSVTGRVFEATRAPAESKLNLHQEMAYLPQYPKQLAFYCLQAPASGGETLMGNMRQFDREVSREFRAAIQQRGVLYTRNFRAPGSTLGNVMLDAYHRTWVEAFGTQDRDDAAAQCDAMQLGHAWLDDGSLSVTYRAAGFARHPLTGVDIWFNQIATQSITPGNMGAEFCAEYRKFYGDDKPYSYRTTFGDGGVIADDDIAALYPLLDKITIAIPWQHGDVMLLDNFYTAHGRNPFTGQRAVHVALLN